MKKLLAFILLLLAFSAGCLFPALGVFAMNGVSSSVHGGMNHDVSGGNGMHNNPGNDSDNMHECCESPFIDIITLSNNAPISKSNIDDSRVLYILHESLLSNSSDRLNSPPKCRLLFYDSLKNIYISLIGIVKNNS